MDERVWFPDANNKKPGWSFLDAAARFWATRGEFLTVIGNEVGPRGCWELTCFPLKDFIGKEMNGDRLADLRKTVSSLSQGVNLPSKRYDAVKRVEEIFRDKLAFPPVPLSTAQDRVEVARRAFAVSMFWKGRGFNWPPFVS